MWSILPVPTPPGLRVTPFTDSSRVYVGIQLGVVGRTGCGKSSLLSTLLRLTEVVQGDIELDGVSLTRLGLADARAGWVLPFLSWCSCVTEGR